jgi:hypothetical protein
MAATRRHRDLWWILTNKAMENGSIIDGLPIKNGDFLHFLLTVGKKKIINMEEKLP